MRTISWTKTPLIILFAAAIAAGCGSDSKAPASTDAGLKAKCKNGVLDPGEACDGTKFPSGKTCSTATMGMSTTGSLSCSSDCQTVLTTGCTKAGTGGTVGNGGSIGNGGAAQGGGAGKGGGGGKPKTDAGKGGSGGTSTDGSAPADASGD